MKLLFEMKKLGFFKKRWVRILLIAECVLVLLSICNLFGHHRETEVQVPLIAQADGEQYPEGVRMETDPFFLAKGSFRVEIGYSTDTDFANRSSVRSESLGERYVGTNGAVLFAGTHQIGYDLWLYRDAPDLQVFMDLTTGSCSFERVEIKENNRLQRMILFQIMIAILIIDLVIGFLWASRENLIGRKQRIVGLGLALISLISVSPALTDYTVTGADLVFHLMRIEGIKDSLAAGTFPVRISPEWQQGYGYASPIFYGETLLYVGGLLRLIGFPVSIAYKIDVLILSVATVLISYRCFYKMIREEFPALLACGLYSCSVYRVFKLFISGAVGEMLAMLIMPIVIYGFWKLLSTPKAEKVSGTAYVPIAVSLALLVQTHLLSGEMSGLFIIITCICMVKTVFRPQVFRELVKAAVGAVFLSAWFLVPMVDFLTSDDLVIENVSARTIQFRGLLPAHLLTVFFRNGQHAFISESGLYDTQAVGIGSTLTLVLVVFLLFWVFGKMNLFESTDRKTCKVLTAFGTVTAIMSLSLFPWDAIQNMGGILKTLVSSLQFPNRWLMLTTLFTSLLAGYLMKALEKRDNKAGLKGYLITLAVLFACSNLFLYEDFIYSRNGARIYNSQGMGTGYISGAEYLPYGADAGAFVPHDPRSDQPVEITDYTKGSLGGSANVVNTSGNEAKLSFPLLYYKGYKAFSGTDGSELPVGRNEQFEVAVTIPENFAGTVTVRYVPPIYWRASEIVSLITLILIILQVRVKRKEHEKVLE